MRIANSKALIRLMRMGTSEDANQTAENANSVDLDNTAYKEWQVVYSFIQRRANSVDHDQTENGK